MKILKFVFVFFVGFFLSKVIFNKFDWYNFEVLEMKTLKFADGSNYQGTIKTNLADGKGTLVWSNGDHYDGEFASGLMQGQGVFTFANGDTYRGSFFAGYPDGEGTFEYSNGDKYQGEVAKGYLHGEGNYNFSSGGKYSGEFEKGFFQGKGTLETLDGARYIGLFTEGLYDGQGSFKYANGDVYIGKFKQGLFEGFGSYHLAAGDKYIGNFHKGQLTGEGEHHTNYGVSYKGEFDNWVYQGNGALENGTGEKYQGEFVAGLYHGHGELTNAKESYKGEFSYGYYQGQGELEYKDGTKYVGQFKGGLANGEGVYSNLTGDSFEADWINGKAKINDKLIIIGKDYSYKHDQILNNQASLLAEQLNQLPQSEVDIVEHYHLLVAGDGSQKVFQKEVETIKTNLPKDTTIILANQLEYNGEYPLATKISLEKALKEIDAKMDPEDVLFLYFTSHGSKQGALTIKQAGFKLNSIYHQDIKNILDQLDIKQKIIMVSSCYSGTFIEILKDAHTSILTASSAQKTSFGCSNESEMTWFAKAFFEDLPVAEIDLNKQFEAAVEKVKVWETEKNYTFSEPQIWFGEQSPRVLPIYQQKTSERLKQSEVPIQEK